MVDLIQNLNQVFSVCEYNVYSYNNLIKQVFFKNLFFFSNINYNIDNFNIKFQTKKIKTKKNMYTNLTFYIFVSNINDAIKIKKLKFFFS